MYELLREECLQFRNGYLAHDQNQPRSPAPKILIAMATLMVVTWRVTDLLNYSFSQGWKSLENSAVYIINIIVSL